MAKSIRLRLYLNIYYRVDIYNGYKCYCQEAVPRFDSHKSIYILPRKSTFYSLYTKFFIGSKNSMSKISFFKGILDMLIVLQAIMI